VRAHLVSDVEVGAFLSGGIDSTAIVSLMRQVGQEKIKTVSVVFPDNKLDESKYSRLAAKKYNTEHIEIPFYEKDLLDDFENIMSAMDQPTIDGINTYFVSKAAKQAGLKVVLSGMGGDELFGGYPSFRNIPKYQKIKNLPFAKMFMKAAAPLLKNNLPAKAIHYMKNPGEPNAEYKLIRGLFTDEELTALGWQDKSKKDKVKSEKVTTNDPMTISAPSSLDSARDDTELRGIKTGRLQYISYLESCYYMRNQLLRDSDVFSMAHSLELRVPFVDHLLYAAVLPYLDSGFDKYFPKKMLVNAVGDIPDEIVHRPKFGFTFPFEDWISRGQLKDLMIVPKASLWEKNKDLNNSLGIEHSALKINDLHWSRVWAMNVIAEYIK
jgi:asparagine synthase (glutamine-hydrolysing)